METRPRRSHHRPLQGKLDTRSLPSPKQFHLRLQPRCNHVQAASGRPCWSATSRGFTTPRVGVICPLLSPVPRLAFPGVSAPCVRGRARVGACVCVCVPCLGLRGPFCVSALLVLLRWPPLGPRRGCLLVGVLPGSVPVSWFFFSGISQDTWGSDESATGPHQLRKSSKLRAQQISRAKVESHSLSTLSVYQMARPELRL